MNFFIYWQEAIILTPRSEPITTIRYPGRQILFYDSMSVGHGYNGDETSLWKGHFGGLNYLYLDGHAEHCRDPGPSSENSVNGWQIIE